ncbi:hypothetical protein VE03_09797 [Pseudogymnoascus sp. 23342-1-I1]|nr:hypothetical protein VE03_09797 [Pseudogymnoascus sp. 23342-1-I1]
MSSGGQLARNRALSLGSGRSSKGGRAASMADFSMPDSKLARDFEPSDATASMFLYAQGNTVVCAHHDTLTIERRFSRHKEEVLILVVDNVSERGAGRLVLSYDAGQTAIVWDLMTGDEVARFASYNSLSVAAWMRNGNVAFGNAQGNVILFEPSTSEHISARTIDQVPITALAPSADCRTYAIGYQNGSLLIASLQPRFTILHNLTTSRAPSPIVTLAWHASSSRQKSDMLATQTHDGDLRVWSIAKSPSSNDSAKVVRVLKRNENSIPGPNWLAWSKNGRIIQYSEGETSSWDVRTKNVTYETVPTLEHVKGIAIYGPGATLFTLGRSNTAQQFDLNSPPVLVANVQHPANLLPPSPPVSIEEQQKGIVASSSSLSEIPINVDVSESDEDHMSPLARIAREMDKLEEQQQYGPDRSGTLSPASSAASSTSRSSAGSRPRRHGGSVLSRGYSDHTLMSPGSSLHSREPSVISSRDSYSVSSVSSSQMSGRSRPRASRLRQEILRSPEDKIVVDLFKFTKSRLSDIPYAHPQVPQNKGMSHHELRRQMLNTIFGWNGEADDLVRDELSRHPMGSPNRLLLTKWLGDIDTDIMATSSESMTASDWMLLALSGIGGQTSQQKVARAYVQRLLEKGDVHTAATIMIGMGDQNDAIEIYVSHKCYMEALILTCMVYPADWGRQTQLLRKWGEWAVQHSQQQLAIRCFSCTEESPAESSYASPSAQSLTFSPLSSSIPEMLSPPLSPPGVVPRGPQRNMAKTAALKLVTTFGEKSSKSKFFGGEDERTPMGNVGTPIAESALSPSGDASTAFLRPGQRSVLNTPASARTATPGGYQRNRLPSIGEMPTDVTPIIKMPTVTMPTPRDQTANDAIAYAHARKSSQPETIQLSAATYQPTSRAATASPMMQRMVRNANPLPSPSPDNFTEIKQESRARNGSRGRKPDGLHIQWPPMESIITGDYMTTPELSAPSRRATPSARSVAGSVSSAGGASSRSYKSHSKAGDASPMTGRSLDPYISSLDSATHYAKQKAKQERQASRDKKSRGRSSSATGKGRDASLERGRSGVRYIKPAKRSPTSPVPMSPEDLRDLGAVGFGDEPDSYSVSSSRQKGRDGSQATARPGSKASSRIRRMSPEPLKFTDSRPGSRLANRQASRRTSPDASLNGRDGRGRSKARDGSLMRSPSSPLPMSSEAAKYRRDEDDMDDTRSAFSNRERQRSRQRSASRKRERASSRQPSPERRRRERSTSRHTNGRSSTKPEDDQRRRLRSVSHARASSDLKVGDLSTMKTERQLKKEAAARELEERRRSLARRPSAPPILHPEQLSPPLPRPNSRSEFLRSSTYPSPRDLPPRSQTVDPETQRGSPRGSPFMHGHNRSQSTMQQSPAVAIGLPATPKAMQHPKFDPEGKDIPDVPQIPESYSPIPQLSMGSLNAMAYAPAEDYAPLPQTTFAPLPKTTYQAAPRHIPPRSMSAPIPEEPIFPRTLPSALPTHPAFHAALPPSARRLNNSSQDYQASYAPAARQVNPSSDAAPGTLGYGTYGMGGIDAALHSGSGSNNMIPPPPPPPPAPPILRELMHLAQPPPPPPAPLYRYGAATDTNSLVSGVSLTSSGSGVIEIVMDDEDTSPQHSPKHSPKHIPHSHQHPPPPPPPPAPPAPAGMQQQVPQPGGPPVSMMRHSTAQSLDANARGHNRGRSGNDNSLSNRFRSATERMRSASRGRNGANDRNARTMSPPMEISPYESLAPQAWEGPGGGQGRKMSLGAQGGERKLSNSGLPGERQVERHPREVGASMMEGGMI